MQKLDSYYKYDNKTTSFQFVILTWVMEFTWEIGDPLRLVQLITNDWNSTKHFET